MYKKIAQTVLFACTLVLSPVVLAHSCGCGEGLKHMVSSLKLDDNQKAKIKPILEQLASTIKNDASQMNDLDQQLQQQAESANMDQATVDSLIDKKTKLIGDMMKAKVTAKNQIYAVLNPQQKTELQSKMKKMEEKMADQFKSCHDDE
ncbi:16 kD immunogenic protein [Legionella sainthelensi]|uniref:16 kD immunogenic protein n=1 Tax=Legionella sainthelensi TaxID=28087 RepID=A0A0W0YT83_9GAMM|nr:Spy/CpxP family protein refolding chaperone [Legionella sainthelensi]KTD60114.1 16 kD immunogenic protein [Legionella sainthelensi]VEH32731.1 16 kD immunogenic protein [Legionella sainthelensi]